jgi:membrane protein
VRRTCARGGRLRHTEGIIGGLSYNVALVGAEADIRPAPQAPDATPVASVPSYAERLLVRGRRVAKLSWRAIGRGVVEFYNSDNLTFAASIAYYTLLSLFPFILLLSTFLSKAAIGLGRDSVYLIIQRALPRQFDFVSTQITTLAETPIELSIAGILLTMWAAMGVFGAVTSAVNHAWGVEKDHGFFKHKLISIVMLLCAGLLLMATILLMSAIQVVEASWFSDIATRYPAVNVIKGFVYRNAPTPMFIFIVGLVYYFAPNAKVRLRDVWVGAIMAGLLWRLAFLGFSLLVREARLTVHGFVAPVVVFLLWVYMCAVIFLYGVEVTAAYARLRKQLPQSAPAAPARDA